MERRAAYGVFLGEAETVAVVQGPSDGFWLPGGGSLPGESPEDTLIREGREELARGVRLIQRIGEATQYFYAANEDRHYRMQAAFFRAELTEELNTAAEHELCWLSLSLAGAASFHESRLGGGSVRRLPSQSSLIVLRSTAEKSRRWPSIRWMSLIRFVAESPFS